MCAQRLANPTDQMRVGSSEFYRPHENHASRASVFRMRTSSFIHGGFLYEVTTYKQLDSWLATILQTWQFTP
jgi:hypothetical protein